MADRKISDLTALTTPATGDLIPIVDISEAAAADKNKSITVGELLRGAPDGTAAAPGIAFESDGGNGMFLGGTDILAFSTGGSQAVTIDASQRVGIGTSSPQLLLDLKPSSNVSQLQLTQSNANDGWRFHVDGPGGGDLHINRWASGTETTRVTLLNAGNVGIGTTSPDGKLHVSEGVSGASPSVNSDTLFLENNGQAGITIGTPNNTIGQIRFADPENDTAGRISYEHYNDSMVFTVNNTERARIDSSGRLLVGTTSSRTTFGGNTAGLIQIENNAEGYETSLSLTHNQGTGSNIFLRAPVISLSRTRGTTLGSNTIVQSGDALGYITFEGADGTNVKRAAEIKAEVDGTPGSNDMPGRLVFSTTADGASSPTARLRIGSTGNTLFQNITNYVAPDSDNAVANGASGRRWSEIWAANGTIQTSDQRAKTDITSATLGTSFIKALRPVSYKWVEGGKRHTGEFDEDGNFIYESVPGERTHWGFIAQEVKQSVDAAGVDFGGWVLTDKDDPDSEQALRYDQFIAPLTKALQEAIAKIETLEARLAALEAN